MNRFGFSNTDYNGECDVQPVSSGAEVCDEAHGGALAQGRSLPARGGQGNTKLYNQIAKKQ